MGYRYLNKNDKNKFVVNELGHIFNIFKITKLQLKPVSGYPCKNYNLYVFEFYAFT